MVRAQKRGMGKMCERGSMDERQKYRQTRKQIFRGLPWGGGAQAFWACPTADISRASHNPHRESWTTKGGREEEEKGGARRREDGGGGDKDGGTTLVIGSLATVGWVDVINRNCTCSREPLMALNLHQAWTGGWKRKSQEQRQHASHYPLNLYLHNAMHLDSPSYTYARTHTYTSEYRVSTGDSQDSGPQQPACHISFLGTFSFHFKCITFQTFPFCSTPCDAKPWLEHIVPAQYTFQPLNSISSLATARVSPVIISSV